MSVKMATSMLVVKMDKNDGLYDMGPLWKTQLLMLH